MKEKIKEHPTGIHFILDDGKNSSAFTSAYVEDGELVHLTEKISISPK